LTWSIGSLIHIRGVIMAGMTEAQADEVIDLLKDILEELRNPMCGAGDILEELRGMSRSIENIERDVSRIEGKD